MALSLRMKPEPSPLPAATFRGVTKEFIVAGMQSAVDEVVFGTLKQVGEFGPSGAAALGYLPDVLKVAETDGSQDVRIAALAAVGRMGEAAVAEIERVINFFEDEDPVVACAAIATVGTMGSAAVDQAPEVVTFLQDEAPEFRAAAVTALGGMKAWMYGDEMKKCLDDPEVAVVVATVASIGELGEDGQLLAGNIAGFLTHKSLAVRLAAVKALTSIGDAGERHAEKVAELLAEDDSSVREAVVAYFEKAGKGAKKGIEAASKCLSNSSGRVQAAAAVALGHAKAEKCAKDIAKLLSVEYKEDTSVALSAAGVERKLPAVLRRPACAAATALAMLGDEGAAFSKEVDALITEDTPPEAAAPLIKALGTMGAVSCEAKIRGLLEETASPVREAACFALGELASVAEDADSAKALAARLKDCNGLVRKAAATALGKFENEGPPYAAEVAKLFGDKIGYVKTAAVRAMGSLGQQGQMFATQVARMTFAAAGEAPTRVAACEVLGEMGERGSAFAEDVVALLEDPEGSVREAALKALAKMGSDASPFVSDISKCCSDPLEAVRAAADECSTALGA
mmetsp:Transcript_75028/g.232054  ORF Transcript_75028/g.232054 Transcript_75028/m.232054 type:complete len:571 (+) Transcript_75028:61-1773(+)